MNNEWRIWTGEHIDGPITYGEKVDIQFRDGVEWYDLYVSDLWWDHAEEYFETNIIAWRYHVKSV